MLGTSGSSGERSEPVTANARVLPPFTSGIAGGPSEIVNKHCSLTTHRFDSLLPLNGIATPGMPVFSFNVSLAMVKAGDDVPYFDLSGLAFAQATSSFTFLAG